MEEHYYNPAHDWLLELGLEPHFMTDDVVAAMIEAILPFAIGSPSTVFCRVLGGANS